MKTALRRSRSAVLAPLFWFSLAAAASAACSSSTPVQAPQDAGSTGKSCTPGASVACVGQGGCAGGQVCSADGASLGPCVCGGSSGDGGQPEVDASQADSGDSGLSTTLGAIHVTWILKGAATSSTLTCAQVIGQSGVNVVLTQAGSPTPIDKTFPCVGNSGDFVAVPLGTYTASASILNASSAALGSAPLASVTVATSPCDGVVSNECVQNLAVTISVDGL